MTAAELGREVGLSHRYLFSLSEPYPPYPLGTQDANDFLHAYRVARFGYDWQDDEDREAIDILIKEIVGLQSMEDVK